MLPDWSNLPEHLLVHVLGFVEQAERLRNSALVNAAWAAAARRATRHATCSLVLHQQASLRDFLRHGDSGVQSVKLLDVMNLSLPVTVPLTGVTRLEVRANPFPLPGSALLLTGLRQLDLKGCEFHTPSLAAALEGSRSSLTSLLLGQRSDVNQEANQINNLLRQLTALAELELPCWQGEELPDLPVGLTRLLLRRPHVHPQPRIFSDDVSSFLQPLTSLQVLELGRVSLQHHVPLTSLREVEVRFARLDLSVLSSACALRRLELVACESISGPHLDVSALHGLSDLRLLNMAGSSTAGAIVQLTSLSCISALTQLQLECAISKQQWDVLARDVVSRAPGLRKLELGERYAFDTAPINLDQLRQLVSSCSQLQHLILSADVSSPPATAGLQHLPQTCTNLELFGNQWCPTALAQLTWLVELSLEGCSELSDVELRQLTALRNLQALSVGECWKTSMELGRAVEGLGPGSRCEWSYEPANDGSWGMHFEFKTGAQGSVCEQLQAVCKVSPKCALADWPGLHDELQALREQLSFAPLRHVVVDEEAAVEGGVYRMRQHLVVMAQAVGGLLSRGMYVALLDGLSSRQPTAELFAEACNAVREQNALRLLGVLKNIVDGET